jgi:hypothetical protein
MLSVGYGAQSQTQGSPTTTGGWGADGDGVEDDVAPRRRSLHKKEATTDEVHRSPSPEASSPPPPQPARSGSVARSTGDPHADKISERSQRQVTHPQSHRALELCVSDPVIEEPTRPGWHHPQGRVCPQPLLLEIKGPGRLLDAGIRGRAKRAGDGEAPA